MNEIIPEPMPDDMTRLLQGIGTLIDAVKRLETRIIRIEEAIK